MEFRFSMIAACLVFASAWQLLAQNNTNTEGKLIDPFVTEWLARKSRDRFDPWFNEQMVLRLDAANIDLRRLKPYFIYPNVRRLDAVCNEFLDPDAPEREPQEIAFDNYYLTTIKGDTFPLREFQFVLGKLKLDSKTNTVLLIANYHEACCEAIDALTINEKGQVLDIERICDSGGDGGASFRTQLYYRDSGHYQFIELDNFQWYDSPIDSIQYDRRYGDLYLHPDGMMERYITKKDCTEVVRFPHRKDN